MEVHSVAGLVWCGLRCDSTYMHACMHSITNHSCMRRYVLADATRHSLVLVDELGKGTEVSAGAALAGALLEALDAVGCKVRTHRPMLDRAQGREEERVPSCDDSSPRPRMPHVRIQHRAHLSQAGRGSGG